MVGTLLNVGMTLVAAYPLARRDLYGRGLILGLFVFTMFFNGGLIPSYLLVKDLDMLNTRSALLIPQALSVWNLMIAIAYFRSSIPSELLKRRSWTAVRFPIFCPDSPAALDAADCGLKSLLCHRPLESILCRADLSE